METTLWRRLLIDLVTLLKEFEDKFIEIGRGMDEETEKKINDLIEEKFSTHARDLIVRSKYNISKRIVKRMITEIKHDGRKIIKRASFSDIVLLAKALNQEEKLELVNYLIGQIHLEFLAKRLGVPTPG